MSNWHERPIRLMLVEDHVPVRERVLARLEAEPWIDVIGGVGTVAEAMALVTSRWPDIAVLDVNLGGENGIALCRSVRTVSPATACIFYTSAEIGPETSAAAGAAAVVVKQLVGDQLLSTIRAVAAIDAD